MNINIVLPDEVRSYVEAQVDAGAYSSISEYLLDLVRQDQQRKAKLELETLLREGVDSDGQEATPNYW
jgi:antitoxin ParD1/3/4